MKRMKKEEGTTVFTTSLPSNLKIGGKATIITSNGSSSGWTGSSTLYFAIGDSNSMFDISSKIKPETYTKQYQLINHLPFGVSSIVVERSPDENMRAIQIQKEVQESLKSSRELRGVFNQILSDIESNIVEDAKSYVISVSKLHGESDSNMYSINIYVESDKIGTLINIWNKAQEIVYDNAEKIDNKNLKDFIRSQIVLKVMDTKNGWRI